MKQLETFFKLIIIGILTALVRAYSQGVIPIDPEPLLWPSIFVDGEIQLIAFVVFGSIFYTAIAALFLLIDKNMKGNKFFKGLKFSMVLIIIWTAYSLEPLPHVTLSDKIAYPLVDGGALLVLGILTGLFIGTKNVNNHGKVKGVINNSQDGYGERNNRLDALVDNILSLEENEIEDNLEFEKQEKREEVNIRKGGFSVLNILIIALVFFLGRIVMYKYLRIYSFFGTHGVETLIWSLITGLIIGSVYEVITQLICPKRWYLRFLVFGFIFLGVILIGFNGIKPLIYRMDVVDLFARICGDIASVILGGSICTLFDLTLSRKKQI